MAIDEETRYALEDNLLLFFTGFSRTASAVLKDQDERTKGHDAAMIDNLHYVKDLGLRSKSALEVRDLAGIRQADERALAEQAETLQQHIERPDRTWYDIAINNGAIGGKLIGAGGGGFLMFYAEDKARLRHAMREAGLPEVRFRFDFEGTRIVAQ